jgi:hypothetical protein
MKSKDTFAGTKNLNYINCMVTFELLPMFIKALIFCVLENPFLFSRFITSFDD